MSRIVVKNLPKTVTEDKLRKHFTIANHDITDIQLKKDPQTDKFRGFAFIGFKDESAAESLVQHFNKTFFERNRINVEQFDQDALPHMVKVEKLREEKRKQIEEEKAARLESRKKRKLPDPLEEVKDDPEFKAFLEVQRNVDASILPVNETGKMVEKKQKYIWTDDAVMDDIQELEPVQENKSQAKQEKKTPKNPPQDFKSLEYSVKLFNLPYKVKKQSIKKFFSPIELERVRLPANIKGIAYVNFKNKQDLDMGLRKHKSLLDGKQIDVKIQASSVTEGQETKGTYEKKDKPFHTIKESAADTGRLFIRNLPYTCKPDDLEDMFKAYGPLTEVYLPIDATTKKPKGFAYVTFVFPEHAVNAMDSLGKTVFQGRLIHILPGESKPQNLNNARFNNLSDFKKKKEIESSQTKKRSSTWNTLFLGANAAADVMSARFNVKKSDLIADPNAQDSIAVRMALGETQIVSETKKFLEDHGINLDAFNYEEEENPETKLIRSKTVILVKNLSVGTDPSHLVKMFARFGHVSRVILPCQGITAIVEMQKEVEARKAFDGLINYRLNHVPVYLEWAPSQVFSSKEKGMSCYSACLVMKMALFQFLFQLLCVHFFLSSFCL